MRELLNKKYFVRILAALLVLSAVLVLVLSAVLSMAFRKMFEESEYRNSMNSLSQISFGRESMDMLAENLGRILCSNSYVVAAMTSSTYNSITSTAALNVVNTVTMGTNGVDSIYFYNVQQQKLSNSLTGETVRVEECYDTGVQQLLEQAETQGFLPVFRTIPDTRPVTASAQVYSYVMPYRTGGGLQGIIIINFKTSLLSEMILALSEKGNRYSEQLFAIDQQGNIVGGTQSSVPIAEEDRIAVAERCLTSEKSTDAFVMRLSDDKEHLITFTRSAAGDWIFVGLSNLAESMQQAQVVLIQTIMAAVAAFAIAAMVAVLFAKQLYSPIEDLNAEVLTRFGQHDQSVAGAGDELQAVSVAFNRMARSAEELENNARQNRHQIQNSLKVRLLRGDLSLDDKQITRRVHGLEIPAALEGSRISLMQFKIDNWEQTRSELSANAFDISSYGILNVACELLARPYHAFGSYMGDGRFCFCLDMRGQNEETLLFEATGAAERVQSKIKEIFKMSTSVSLTGPYELKKSFSQVYAHLQEVASYGFLAGHGSIVDETILDKVDNEYYLVSAKQKKMLIEAMRQGKLDRVKTVYQEISDQVAGHSYQNILDTYLYLAYIIYGECFSIEIQNDDFSSLMLSFMGRLSCLETRQECDAAFSQLFDQINQCVLEMNQKQQPDLVEQVKLIVQENYSDKNLCLNQIAQRIGRSAAYVGRLFKEQTDSSVAEYILQIRMQHLKELLDNTEASLSEILDKVGMEKSNYFYTLFRKYFGVSFAAYNNAKTAQTQQDS